MPTEAKDARPVTWPEMEAVEGLSQRMLLNLTKLRGIAANAKTADGTLYPTHLKRTVIGYGRAARAWVLELSAAVEALRGTMPREGADDGASSVVQPDA